MEAPPATATQQLARERDRLKLLLDINNAVVSNLTLEDLLRAISDSLRRVVPHEVSSIGLLDSETAYVEVRSDLLRVHLVPFVPKHRAPSHDSQPWEAREGSDQTLRYSIG
jgi:formate hydrogenlyase transcriptional activator